MFVPAYDVRVNNLLNFDDLHVEPFAACNFLRTFMLERYDRREVEAVSVALGMDAFIAGGFGRAMHRSLVMNDTSYLASYVASQHGDIDVFFRSKDDLRTFMGAHSSSMDWRRSKHAWTTPGNTLQIIDCIVGQPQHIMRSFDISNACVTASKNSIMRPDGYRELHESKQLHVQNWGDHTLQRVRKWFVKHDDLETLHVDCNDEYLSRLKDPEFLANEHYDMLVGVNVA